MTTSDKGPVPIPNSKSTDQRTNNDGIYFPIHSINFLIENNSNKSFINIKSNRRILMFLTAVSF